jgi:hypothetical protein
MFKIKKWVALALPGLAVCVWSAGAAAAPDGLLTRFRTLYAEKGSGAVAALAAGLGVSTRTEKNQLLIPVLVNRSVARSTDFSRRIKQAGARLDAHSRSWTRLLVPVSRLNPLFNAFPDQQLHAPIPAHPAFGLGGIVSQSVALTGADGYQAGGLDGAGVRVAVVDLGFTGLANAISAGELPAATVAVDFTGTGVEAGTKHGVGVAEHVADMAPGATLYCLRVADQLDLENAATYIRDNNIAIANHSVAWVLASYYDDTGPINDIVNQSHDSDGVFWTVASGNHARQHWRGGWQDSDGDGRLEFSASDELMALSGAAGTVSVYLNWNQYGVNNKTDLDLFVQDSAGNTVASSTIRQSRFNDPVEAVAFAYQASQAPYSAFVTVNSGSTAGLDITLFSFSHNFEYAMAASSMMDPASAHGAFAVGAVARGSWNNASPPIRNYSSQGPTTDGRLAPDLVAPDGTSSLAYGTSNGTSFSAPTTAGAAALLLDENGARTALDLADLLHAGAVDVGAAGADNVFGYGKLQLPLIDSDNDQLTNVDELALGTGPLDSDSDNDGLDDYQETQVYLTDPLDPDSDHDGVGDFAEAVVFGTDPLTSNRGDLAPYGSPDGVIDLGDYLVLLRMLVQDIAPNPAEIVFGDLNNSSALDAGDLVLLRQVIDGQIAPP